jgi:SNF2 family DNA or RNA helicase
VVVYPDAQEQLDLELNRLRLAGLVQEIRLDPKLHPLRKTLLRMELLPYQLDGIAFCAGAGRAILADDMGLGKTIQGVGTAELLAREIGISRVLVVCPASVKGQWKSEIERFCNRSVRVIVGSAASRAEEYQQTEFFTVCNYEQVVRDLRHIHEIPWDLVILDEGQRIKNWEAKTTRTLKSIQSRFRLVLSGTPLENRLEELHSVVEFVDDRRLGPDYLFRHRHVVALEGGRTEGYRNLDALRDALRPILLRRTRAQVLTQLPERTDEVLRVPPSQEQLAIHEASSRVVLSIIHKPHLTEMDLLRLQKAMLICRMVADSTTLVDKKEPGHSTKLDRLAELLPALARESDRKVIVFSEWTSMLDLVESRILKPEGLDFVRLDGSVQQSKRPALVRRFQTDPACRFFLASNAGTVGLNLQAADTVVNLDLPWNPAVLEQRIARAHRMGQKRPVHVYLLVTEKTMEEGMLQTLGNKRRMGQAALDFESDVLAVDLSSGIDELKSRLETVLVPPEAPIDENQRSRELARARELSDVQLVRRRRELQVAGGQLLISAFGFVGQLAGRDGSPDQAVTDAIRQNLSACLVAAEDGSQELRLRLPDPSSFDALVRSLALLAGGLGPTPPPR